MWSENVDNGFVTKSKFYCLLANGDFGQNQITNKNVSDAKQQH